jgi:hypothetical protein
MSRWAILKSQLSGKRSTTSSASIHRFEGFVLIPRSKMIWRGFELNLEIDISNENEIFHDKEKSGDDDINYIMNEKYQDIRETCMKYFDEIDTAEFRLSIKIRLNEVEKEETLHNSFAKHLACNDYNGTGLSLEPQQTSSNTDNASNETKYVVYTYIASNLIFTPIFKQVSFWSYTLPKVKHGYRKIENGKQEHDHVQDDEEHKKEDEDPLLKIFTREMPIDVGVGARGLLSNELHGIDNTGNVRVWTAETLLLYTLLENPDMLPSSSSRILEIGGGMTGLCGIGLAMSNLKNCSSITITDGHPDCVKNQQVCRAMQAQKNKQCCNIETQQLRWSKGDEHGDLAKVTNNGTQKFDMILAADCLFFKEFHDDLVWTIANAITPSGVIYMLQPGRGGSMDLFLSKAHEYFNIEKREDYNSQVSSLRKNYDEEGTGYDADIHFPVLIEMRLR